VGDIASKLVGYTSLLTDVQTVLDNLVPREAEVQAKSGAWYLMRIRPYRTLENVIEGAVITFIDITQRKQIEDELRNSRAKQAG
jgi:two-component system CheB/CheR fusion protein